MFLKMISWEIWEPPLPPQLTMTKTLSVNNIDIWIYKLLLIYLILIESINILVYKFCEWLWKGERNLLI